MKRAISLIAAIIISTAVAVGKDNRFSLALGTGPTTTGYISQDGSAGTMFWNLSLAPDYRFNAHIGMTADIGAGLSFAGAGANWVFNTFQAELYLGPYYEWTFTNWYLDAMAGPFARYRNMTIDKSDFILGQDISIGVAAGIRAGISIGPRTDLFSCLRIEPSLYDPMAKETDLYIDGRISGNVNFSIGVRYRFGE